MKPSFRNVHNRFKLNGIHFSFEELNDVAYNYIKEGYPYEQILGWFILDWIDEKDYIYANTSGSTGVPKKVKLSKQAMVNSAIATGDFFNLEPGDSALLCLPMEYIAGKMMLIRAVILGLELDLVEPTSKIELPVSINYDFSAMVPLQVRNSLNIIENIKTLIVGGSPMSQVLKGELQTYKTHVYETYGMTETVTHIALKQINNFSDDAPEFNDVFRTLEGVTVSQDERGCMVINAPKLAKDIIITNDVIKWHSHSTFEWLGRFDHVINSGGVKLFPEQIEAKLQKNMSTRFFVAALPDENLGQKLILVVESEDNRLDKKVFSVLDKFEIPKAIYAVSKFEETTSGKIRRRATLKKITINCNN
ncbi:AMP-binding protein [Gaetbulibacter saemankumensis]|uniref:AMP-binding protein n=1 Tax=Gaetbulibacter saemankumensis TaxID=311208 RepID=UPI00040A9A85|nr:AMP-binding protein [Gaetbulibacter saemankumensis]